MMQEALKIVKARLNEALDKNDSKAIREACIVLKAYENVDWFHKYLNPVKESHPSGEDEMRTIHEVYVSKKEGQPDEQVIRKIMFINGCTEEKAKEILEVLKKDYKLK